MKSTTYWLTNEDSKLIKIHITEGINLQVAWILPIDDTGNAKKKATTPIAVALPP